MSTIDVQEYLATSTGTQDITQLSAQELGKEDFLKLLVAELSNQNPMEPMDNKDLILQLAQFSTLEGTQNLNEQLTDFSYSSNLATASGMIGKEVVYRDADSGLEVTGTVDKVNIDDGEVQLVVDGVAVPVAAIQSIADATASITAP